MLLPPLTALLKQGAVQVCLCLNQLTLNLSMGTLCCVMLSVQSVHAVSETVQLVLRGSQLVI